MRSGQASKSVLVLGRIDEAGGRKGHRDLIECWKRVVARVPEARLVIAGGGRGTAVVRSWVEQSGAADAIEMLGFVPENALEMLWARIGVFAMPSRGEGFGLVYIEAMRHGVPIIASVHDAAGEINLHGETGFNVNLDQPGDLENHLVELLTNEPLAARFGAAGRARWNMNFTYEAFRGKFVPILREFLDM
jgi:phosphatidylinositol alpha-1,6-mannosyltransferase